MNIERGKAIPKSHIMETEPNGDFSIAKSTSASKSSLQEDDLWEVSIPQGTCICPSFKCSYIPCKHMFAVFHHYPAWTWNNLPLQLTESAHMLLDADATGVLYHQSLTEAFSVEDEAINDNTCAQLQSAGPCTSGPIPPSTTQGKKLYSLQKRLEESLGRCRTLAFLTSDIPALERALHQWCIRYT